MVDMSCNLQQRIGTNQSGLSDVDKRLAGLSIFTALLLGLAIDYELWWLGIPSSLAMLLMAGVFTRRHIVKKHPTPLNRKG